MIQSKYICQDFSIMHACNETGGVNDIEQLVKIAKSVSPKVVFHSDGVQAVGKMPINLSKLGQLGFH